LSREYGFELRIRLYLAIFNLKLSKDYSFPGIFSEVTNLRTLESHLGGTTTYAPWSTGQFWLLINKNKLDEG